MYANMHSRIGAIAELDSDREDEVGARQPSVLRIILKSGKEIGPCHLVDGANSHDVETIDVVEVADDVPGSGKTWTILSSEIAAVHETSPRHELVS